MKVLKFILFWNLQSPTLKNKQTNKQELVEPGAQLWSRVLALPLRGVEVGGDTQCLSYKRGTSWESIVPSSPSQVFCSE